MSIRAARARITAAAVVLAALPALAGTPAAADDRGALDRGVRLDFLGERELPNALAFQGTTVGGLSAISYDAKTGTYYVISDDRSATGPARFYTARVDFARGGALKGVTLTGTHPLLRPDGTAFPPTSTATSTVAPDPEGIAVDPRGGGLVWTSEGERIVPADGPALLGDPWIRRATTTGAYTGQLPLPPQLRMNSQEFGPRKNQTLEGLTFTLDGRRIVTAMEDPLYQDGDVPTPEHGALTRITVHDSRTGRPLAQYAYPLQPLFATPPAGSTDTNGVSDLVALGNDRFLVLERASIFSDNNWKARIYLVDLRGATDVLGRDSLTSLTGASAARPVKPVRKTLVTDLSDVPGLTRIDNIEGITLGPRLPDGRRTVVLVSDDNFAAREVTQFIAFAAQGI
ncbi:esterase-like activity of phytase family protein [Streptomyces sp. NBC_00878]|uniref:esterase-like activity of phytase family protein n=1 Tax=Streptomyces sp. NBC_00878 TaxID=2975854 RepID=UPI0022596DDD|nr:esterase-like activity of phytase family protein [Streptomyces sp. NBC_00878]MCX4909206.1 esterase-like activity of phytase family protein [Streptomyces sp. NBC_00878]